jgi:hypothetical protein
MLRISSMAMVWMVASGLVLAQGNARPHQEQINAAVDQAVAALQIQVERMPLNEQLTVGDLLDRTGGREELVKTLRRAQMVGGPRWIDSTTCQVRLEIAGPRVAGIISAIAAAHPKSSPIDPSALQQRLGDWQNQTFVSEGANFSQSARTTYLAPSTAPDSAPPAPSSTQPADLIPQLPPSWVDHQLEAAGRSPPLSPALKTLRAAQADAQQSLLRQLQNLPLTSQVHLSEAMERNPAIQQAVERALGQARIDRVQYKEDGGVEVRMTLPLWQLWRELVQANP